MKILSTFAVALVLSIGHSAAQAVIVPFSDLLEGASITAGDKVFSGFQVDFVQAIGAVSPDYAQITVESLDDGGLDPGPGLRFTFNDQLTVFGATDAADDPLLELLELIDLTFSFTVTAADGFRIKDNSLVLNAELIQPQLDLGVFVLEQVFDPDNLVDPIAIKTAELSYLDIGGDSPVEVNDPTDSAEFGPLQSIRVTKNIFVGASLNGEVARVFSVEQRFSQMAVPVPPTLLLVAVGLVGAFAPRWKRH